MKYHLQALKQFILVEMEVAHGVLHQEMVEVEEAEVGLAAWVHFISLILVTHLHLHHHRRNQLRVIWQIN
jgi:hypothetical protein